MFQNSKLQGWRDSNCCSLEDLSPVDPTPILGGYLQLQHQGIQCPFLASLGNVAYTYRHTEINKNGNKKTQKANYDFFFEKDTY